MFGVEIWGREWAEKIKSMDFALLPLASFEYHGPIAPVGTDAAIADALARYAAKRYRCIVYPTVYYTACPAKTHRCPTISIEPATMLAYLKQVLQGIYDAGFSRVLMLNAHDGNMGIARAAAEAIAGDTHTLLINWWQLLSDEETSAIFPSGGRGHGGPYETSAAWAAYGQNACGEAKYDRPSHKLPGIHVHVEGEPKDFTGYAGAISEASFDKGEVILERAGSMLDKVVAEWIDYTRKDA